MNEPISQELEEKNIREAVAAFDDFMSTISEISTTHQKAVDEFNGELEKNKIDTIKKQLGDMR